MQTCADRVSHHFWLLTVTPDDIISVVLLPLLYLLQNHALTHLKTTKGQSEKVQNSSTEVYFSNLGLNQTADSKYLKCGVKSSSYFTGEKAALFTPLIIQQEDVWQKLHLQYPIPQSPSPITSPSYDHCNDSLTNIPLVLDSQTTGLRSDLAAQQHLRFLDEPLPLIHVHLNEESRHGINPSILLRPWRLREDP